MRPATSRHTVSARSSCPAGVQRTTRPGCQSVFGTTSTVSKDSPWSRRLMALWMSARRISARSRRQSARILQASGDTTRASSRMVGSSIVNMVIASGHCDARSALGDSESPAMPGGSKSDGDARALGGILGDEACPGMAATTGDPLVALATHALGFVRDGAVVGLGSGRAASAFVRALAARVHDGFRVRGVATSEETARLARELGIELVGLEADIDLTVDGADEVDGELNLIKGYGGAFVRERIVAAASRRQVILVTADKLVETLGSHGRLPVEVLPFALPLCRRRLGDLELKPTLRAHEDGPFVTDNFNVVLDCAVGPIEDPAALEQAIRAIPGVIDTGLFLGTADTVVVVKAAQALGDFQGLRERGRRALRVHLETDVKNGLARLRQAIEA